MKNVGISLVCGLGLIGVLQRKINWYGNSFTFTNFVIDASIFMLSTGTATLWSFN